MSRQGRKFFCEILNNKRQGQIVKKKTGRELERQKENRTRTRTTKRKLETGKFKVVGKL